MYVVVRIMCHHVDVLEFNDSELSSRDTEGEDVSEVGIDYVWFITIYGIIATEDEAIYCNIMFFSLLLEPIFPL